MPVDLGRQYKFLAKYEQQLAALWRTWRALSRLRIHGLHFEFKASAKTRQILKMYRLVKKFNSTNEPAALEKALSIYFTLRPNWLLHEQSLEDKLKAFSGWANKESLELLKTSMPEVRFKKVFRPDVWYLSRGQASLFSGFLFESPLSHVIKILENEDGILKDFRLQAIEMQTAEIPRGETLRLEGVFQRGGNPCLDWFASYKLNPQSFTQLVEAAVDRQMAAKALVSLNRLANAEIDSELARSFAIFNLLANECPTSKTIRGWKLVKVKNPQWLRQDGLPEDPTADPRERIMSARYFKASNAKFTNGGLIFQDDVFIDWDSAQHPSLGFVAGNANSVVGSSGNLHYCFVKDSPTGLDFDSGIILGSRVDSNWFHFLIETLPRLLVLDKFLDKRVPVIASSRIPNSAKEALALVTERTVHYVDATTTSTVIEAYVPGPVIFHPDTQFMWGKYLPEHVNFALLRELRSIILAKLNPPLGAKKTYWSRPSNHRTIINSKTVRRLLERRGFTTRDPSSLTFAEQVASIHSSEVLVAAGGAVMSNFIFASDSTKVLVLVSAFGKAYPMPVFLGQISGASVTLLGGPPKCRPTQQNIIEQAHASFRIKPKSLRDSLGDLETD